jgi:fatty acid desaturase
MASVAASGSVLDRVLYVVIPASFIALLPLGIWTGRCWLAVAMGALVVPIADEIIGPREATVSGPSIATARLLLLAFFAAVGWSLGAVRNLNSWFLIVLAGASSGYVLGAVGIAAAHELGHRRSWWDQFLGQALLACIGYGHYQVAHSRHHVRAGLPEDPASARKDESLWGFLPRYIVGIWRDAMDAAAHHRGLRRYRPAVLMTFSLSAILLIAVFLGPKSLVFWLSQGVTGLFLIASVDYIQHWGLQRRRLDDGRYERQGPSHTWESHFWLSERLTMNLTRHNFHHLLPGRDADTLERVPEAPQMPCSYSSMVMVAAVPPIFRRMMIPRLPSGASAPSEERSLGHA